MEFHTREMDEHFRVKNFTELKGLLDLAKSKHVKVVFITTPTYSTYSKYADPKIENDNDSLIHDLCKYGDTYYLNYFRSEAFNISDFADNDHLNYVGAEKLSKLLDSQIIRPAFKL